MITMRALIERAERHFPANPAIVPAADGQGGMLTWAEFAVRVRRAAGALRSLGVNAGDRFAIICRNDPRQAELLHAGYWMGAVAVPINHRLAPPEIAEILDGAAPRIFVVEDRFAELVSDSRLADRSEPRVWIGAPGGEQSEADYESLRDASPEDAGRTGIEGDDALLLYTGGTTGRAKGVRLSHRNIAANGLQLVEPYGVAEDDVMLHVAPMFHSADLLGSPFSHVGAAHAYLPDFSPDAFLAAVERSRATFSLLTPTVIIRIIREGRMGDFDLSSLRRLTYGSAPMDAVWIRRMVEAFPGVELVHSYGLTETSPILTTLGWKQHLAGLEGGDRLRSVGRPLVGVELRIVDDDGERPYRPARRGRSRFVPRTYRRATSTVPARRRPSSGRAGSTPETWGGSMPRVSSISSTARRTSSSPVARASGRRKSRRPCTRTPTWSRRRSSGCRIRPGARRCWPWWCSRRAPHSAPATARTSSSRTAGSASAGTRSRADTDSSTALPKSAMGKILKADLRRRYREG